MSGGHRSVRMDQAIDNDYSSHQRKTRRIRMRVMSVVRLESQDWRTVIPTAMEAASLQNICYGGNLEMRGP